ncbi:uncharacterized protein PGTG_08225 [Puccinia graminis f. sp. tritici CRL 75-36-700-3]|uniref:C3H1-type domain-containing protein n=1 Tax=Puccinia graminis f. sp. tritici (strain CRL 75-36-700-3 / race SCCL) TaxID=418459 RepID=E3KBW4_PUCGT|nr:uncharacterized protein PGTG_08225 [Puccinia graminis f. sp. tritici CRL 75-36-700-3]EFP81976.2 hypothetical protein PGTG_08225 [Puccinia graminis f. sp. tritici CRL 75-36-700-3]
MFPTLKLFHRINCPDNRPPQSTCSRDNCLFNHSQPKPEPEPKPKPRENGTQKQKQSVPPTATSSQPKVEPSEPLKPQPPRIDISKTMTSSHTFPSVRQKLLETLYQEYLKLYQGLKMSDEQASEAARRDSLQEELDCLRASSQKTYRNAVISRVVKIRKRASESLSAFQSLTGTTTEFDQLKQAQQTPKS